MNAASDSSLAEDTATLAIVSHGCMVLGVGLGYQPADFAVCSVPQAERVQQWFQGKQTGWYAGFEDPRMPVTSTLLDRAHNALAWKLFMMQGFNHPQGSQQAFLQGLAHLYNLVPYQHRAQHAGHCGVEVEGDKIPTGDWWLNLQILTSRGFQ